MTYFDCILNMNNELLYFQLYVPLERSVFISRNSLFQMYIYLLQSGNLHILEIAYCHIELRGYAV